MQITMNTGRKIILVRLQQGLTYHGVLAAGRRQKATRGAPMNCEGKPWEQIHRTSDTRRSGQGLQECRQGHYEAAAAEVATGSARAGTGTS